MTSRILISLILLVLIFQGCNKHIKQVSEVQIEKKWKVKVQNLDLLYKDVYKKDLPIDSSVYKNVLRWKKNEECASLLSFAKTDIELLRLRKKNTDYNIHKYRNCEAILYNDTIEISFNFPPFGGGGGIAYFELKPITISITNSEFTIDLTHSSDVSTITKQDGKWVKTPFPKSTFKQAKLDLDKEIYERGDTIKGKLYALSTFMKQRTKKDYKTRQFVRYETQENEIIKGYFRAILETREDRCLLK